MDADESVHIQLRLEISQGSADELLAGPGMQRQVIPLCFQPVDAGLLQEAQASPCLDRNALCSRGFCGCICCGNCVRAFRKSNKPDQMGNSCKCAECEYE
jgi:hypothetical protein